MARYVIVCAFSGPPPGDLASALRLADRLRLVRGEQHPELWISWSRFHEIEARLATALTAGRVRTAALLPAVPSPDQRWILMEWHGRLVVHRTLADQIDPRSWAEGSRYELIDLEVYAPSQGTQATSVTGYPNEPGRRRADWIETVAEYRASLETGRSVLITAPAQQIMSSMRDWFGELSDGRVGGAIAVLALSGVTSSTRSLVVLRSPAALGLRRVTGFTALTAHRQAGRVTARAWGTSSDDPTRDISRTGHARQDGRSLTAELTAARKATGAHYGIVAELTARMDTEVLIDTGLIFEQDALNGVQNLAVAAGSVIPAPAGRAVSTARPAWCLNRHLAPPAGELLRPTALFLPLPAGVDQGTVWDIVERSRDALGAST